MASSPCFYTIIMESIAVEREKRLIWIFNLIFTKFLTRKSMFKHGIGVNSRERSGYLAGQPAGKPALG